MPKFAVLMGVAACWLRRCTESRQLSGPAPIGCSAPYPTPSLRCSIRSAQYDLRPTVLHLEQQRRLIGPLEALNGSLSSGSPPAFSAP